MGATTRFAIFNFKTKRDAESDDNYERFPVTSKKRPRYSKKGSSMCRERGHSEAGGGAKNQKTTMTSISGEEKKLDEEKNLKEKLETEEL